MIAIILGGSPSVFAEAAEAATLIGRRHVVVAANLAGIHWCGRLDGWASLHPEALPEWRSERKGAAAARHFVPGGLHALPWAEKASDRWNGSSGLYAAQVALFELGATAAVLCGVPMDSEAGHFAAPGAWAGTADYRLGFEAALRECGGRVRSMGGWTRELFGPPTSAWASAVENIKPLGVSVHHHARIAEMHKVTNTGKSQISFWAKNEIGQLELQHLPPGQSVDVEIDPEQPKFKGGDLKISEIGGKSPAKKTRAAKPRSAKSNTPAAGAAPSSTPPAGG